MCFQPLICYYLTTADQVEEVFAEEYDQPTTQEIEEVDVKPAELIFEVPNCPNRTNPYHVCVQYCTERLAIVISV